MKKIAFVLWALCVVVFVTYTLLGFYTNVSFRVDSVGMQRVTLEDKANANMYLLKLKLTHCNRRLHFGCIPYSHGISDSVAKIVVYDGKGKTINERVLNFPMSRADSVKTIWLRYENKEIPCNYCMNIGQLQKTLNSMTQNIRSEYFCKEENAHYMYRLFSLPKELPLPKKLVFRFDKYSLECDVNNTPQRVKVTRIDKMEPYESYD